MNRASKDDERIDRTALRAALSLFFGGIYLVACGLELGGSVAADASLADTSPNDASLDLEASPDSAALDGGGAEASPDDAGDAGTAADASATDADSGRYACGATFVASCTDCDGSTALCGTTKTCVSDCHADCTPGSLACFSCAADKPVGLCEPAATASCLGDAGYARCPCTATAAACPGLNQVCVGVECRSCGEALTDTLTCKDGTGGMKCKAADPDPNKRYHCK